jgi:hypothetical protein
MSQCQDCSTSQTCTEQAAGLAAATAGSTWRIWLSNAAWTGKYRCSKLQHAGHTGLCNTLTVSNVSCTVWDYVDAGLAYVFGLDESKYQWAIDRHNMLLPQVSCSKARLALKYPCQQSYRQDHQNTTHTAFWCPKSGYHQPHTWSCCCLHPTAGARAAAARPRGSS